MTDRPVKILRVIARLNVGGPAIHAVLLTHAFDGNGFQSMLVTGTIGRHEGDMRYLAQNYGVAPHIIAEIGREISWSDDLVAFIKLYRVMRRYKPDIVHTHTAKAGALGRLAAFVAGVPIRIHTFHGHVFHHYFSPFKTWLFLAVERILARLTTKIVAISDHQLIDLARRYQIGRLDQYVIIPLGFDLGPFLRIVRDVDRKSCDRPFSIGLIGRLVSVKNPTLTLDAFSELIRPGGHQDHLYIAGDGDLRPMLEKAVHQSGLAKRVSFVGWQHALAALYEKLDVVILTSHNEGTPVVLIEAMAAGLPFVATRVGGVADLVCGTGVRMTGDSDAATWQMFDNGILVEPGDVQSLAVALRHLRDNPELRWRMGQAGRAFVRERFSKERLVGDLRTVYEGCVRQAVKHTGGICTI